MIKLYDHELSGNCHKVRLMLSLLDLEHQIMPVDLTSGKHKSSEFFELNPFRQVPVLTDGDLTLRDSQAILVYLAGKFGGEDWLPSTPEPMSKVFQWLSIAANEIQNSLSAARLYYLFNLDIDLNSVQTRAEELLQVMDQLLIEHSWLELGRPTIADIACYPYIGLAADGKISLGAYPHIVAWIDRIKKLPGYISMPGL